MGTALGRRCAQPYYPSLRFAGDGQERGIGQGVCALLPGWKRYGSTSGITYVKALEEKMAELGIGKIASLSGRYYAMDRDNRWDRVEKAYRALRFGEGKQAKCGACAIQASYDEGVTDEFVVPTVVAKDGEAVGKIQDKDP